MNKPDDKTDKKMYYSYDLPENKKMIAYIGWITWGLSFFTVVSLIFLILFIQPKDDSSNNKLSTDSSKTTNVALAGIGLLSFGGLAGFFWNDYNRIKHIFKSEPVVTHSWGLETSTDGLRADIKWEEISSLESSMIKFGFFWNLNKYALVYKSGTFYFYDIIENVKFLENYIRKNIKSYIDSQNEIKWTRK